MHIFNKLLCTVTHDGQLAVAMYTMLIYKKSFYYCVFEDKYTF